MIEVSHLSQTPRQARVDRRPTLRTVTATEPGPVARSQCRWDRCCRRLRAVQGHLVVLGSGWNRPLGDVSSVAVSSRIGRQSHKSPLTAGPGPALGVSPIGYLVVLQQFWSYRDGLGECRCYLFAATATWNAPTLGGVC